jgi:ABC-type branched-subunit amino acid transport system ATPase component
VLVGDAEAHTLQAAAAQVAQQLRPERLRLRLAAVEADHLAPTGLVDAVRDHQALAHDAAAISDLLDFRVEPDVRVAALERPRAEGFHLLIEAGADARHLAAGDAQPERLDQLLERFTLTDAADRLVKTYSGRMRRRLDIGASLIARPPVLFLDEPTTGLDPRTRNDA